MSWKRYQNELMVLLSLIVMVGALLYKNGEISSQIEKEVALKHSIAELREIIALKKVWADKKISKRVDKLKAVIPKSKLKWRKKGRRLTALYEELSAKELNRVISKILNLPVEIRDLNIEKRDASYHVEFKCKW